MASTCCNKCGNNGKCGCNDSVLHIPPSCTPNPNCPVPNPCPEEFSTDCIIYTGPTLLCEGEVEGTLEEQIINGTTMAEMVQLLVSFTCTGNFSSGRFNLRQTVLTNNSVALTWDNFFYDTSFEVYVKLSSAPIVSFVLAGTVTVNYTTITSLLPATSYDFYVKGVVSNEVSNYISVTTL